MHSLTSHSPLTTETNRHPERNQTVKAHIKLIFARPELAAALGLMLASGATAQTITNLYNFTGGNDGSWPRAGLILSSNTLYGTTSQGGSGSQGTVFSIQTDGTGFTNLYSFAGLGDGANPFAALVLGGATLYGTAQFAGDNGFGTVFAVNTNGTGFTNLYSFTGADDGANPYAGLALSGSTLYGTTINKGVLNDGTVFSINTNGTGFNLVHGFFGGSDGAYPYAGLIVSGTTLYGTARQGGDAGSGTVFKSDTDGMNFVELYGFTDFADGGVPYAPVVLLSNMLYGTAYEGGSANFGAVYRVSINGTGYTNLHSFRGGSDGANPYAGLVLAGNRLYGTTYAGGDSGIGTVFAINTDGTGYTNLYSFGGLPDGSHPYGGLVASGNKLYGTTFDGGSFGNGTVFCLSLGLPQLTIAHFRTNVVLTWPTNYPGFTLQTTTDLFPPSVWAALSPAPAVVNGLNMVTNAITGSRKFYRLIQ
jgi:uncharacterized repeat protein (TIGR03803 family)